MTGSLLVPLKALALNVLSLTATFGAMVYIFQDGHFRDWLGFTPTGSIDVFTPILMFCIAFGLSMDYEVFLLSRIKEEYDLDRDNEHAVAVGLQKTGRIVTAAALLLTIVFIGIATSGSRDRQALRRRADVGRARRRVPDPGHAGAGVHAPGRAFELVGPEVAAPLAPALRHLGERADRDPRPRVRIRFLNRIAPIAPPRDRGRKSLAGSRVLVQGRDVGNAEVDGHVINSGSDPNPPVRG